MQLAGAERLRRCMGADGEGFTPSALAHIEGHKELAHLLRTAELRLCEL
jgi:hypothetical protein